MHKAKITISCLVCLLTVAIQAQASITVHTSDFIADGSRSHFNGFESIPNDGTFYTGGGGPYVEDTISVAQINGDPGNDIWVTYNSWNGHTGNHSWYPNGGDSGYTEISLAGGIDFDSVGFHYGTGNGPSVILYELLDNGVVVLSGTENLSTATTNYLGFSGGGFDTIRVRDGTTNTGGSVTDGSFQALSIDNVETLTSSFVPEPGTIVIWSMFAGIGLAFGRRRRNA